jgi:hypothetical protein
MALVFVVSSGGQLKDLNSERTFTLLKDTGFKVQNEITIAARASEGYERNFELQQKLDNVIDYNISLNNNLITISTNDDSYWIFVPNITGQIQKGFNTIKKQGGSVLLNE